MMEGGTVMRSRQRGTAMILSMSLIFLLGALGSTTLLRSLHEHHLEDRSAARQQAFFLAEAGVDQALINLQTADLADDVNTAALSTGTFQVDNPPVSLGPLQSRITAHGLTQGEARHVEATIQLTPESVFQFALFGDHQVTVSGNAQTDSYDSRDGAYNDDLHDHHGDVGTNTTTTGAIAVSGSIFVDGQLVVGPNVSNPPSVVQGFNPVFVTGGTSPPSDTQDVVSAGRTFPTPDVVVPGDLTCVDLRVNGNDTVTLAPGTYCYHNLTIEGGGTLTSSGAVTIYLTGELTAKGNSSMGVPSSPKQMLVLMSSSEEVTLEQGTLTGSTQFSGALYAPNSAINISGNAEIFGSVIARQVNVTGSAEVHYDQALTDVTQVSNLYSTSLVSWRELPD